MSKKKNIVDADTDAAAEDLLGCAYQRGDEDEEEEIWVALASLWFNGESYISSGLRKALKKEIIVEANKARGRMNNNNRED